MRSITAIFALLAKKNSIFINGSTAVDFALESLPPESILCVRKYQHILRIDESKEKLCRPLSLIEKKIEKLTV